MNSHEEVFTPGISRTEPPASVSPDPDTEDMELIIMDNPDPVHITLRDSDSLNKHSWEFLNADSDDKNEEPSYSSKLAKISDHANSYHSDHDNDSDDDGNHMLRERRVSKPSARLTYDQMGNPSAYPWSNVVTCRQETVV